MPFTIECLPSSILTSIFVRLPMPDLMSTELVCKQWKFVHGLVCETKHQLALYVHTYRRDLDDVTRFWYHGNVTFGTRAFMDTAIKVRNSKQRYSQYRFTMKHAKSLTVKFPNITELCLYGLELADFSGFGLLLTKWSKLRQLAYLLGHRSRPFNLDDGDVGIAEWDNEEQCDEQFCDWSQFWCALQGLKSLRHLAIEFDQIQGIEIFVERVLPKLESLYLGIGYDKDGIRMQKLFEAIYGTPLTRLTLTRLEKSFPSKYDHGMDGEFSYFDLKKLLSNANPRVFEQLTHFGWHGDRPMQQAGVDDLLLGYLAPRLRSVTSLDLNLYPEMMDLSQVTSFLRTLSNLVRLRLSPQCDIPKDGHVPESEDESADDYSVVAHKSGPIYRRECRPKEDLVRGFGLFEDLTSENYRSRITSPLYTVTELHLANIEFTRWNQFDYLQRAFPAVQVMHFEECDLTMKRFDSIKPVASSSPAPTVQGIFCNRRQLLHQTLKRFSFLKKVYRNGSLVIDLSNESATEAEVSNMMKVLLRKTKRNEDFFVSDYCGEQDMYNTKQVTKSRRQSNCFDLNYGMDYNNYY